MTLQPRDYQEACDRALWSFLHNPEKFGKNPLVVMATGLGKSLQMAMLKWHLMHNYPTLRILNVTHVKELVEGNYKTLMRLWPAAPAGVYSAGLNRKDTHAQITFCGIQSVAKRAATFGRVDFVIIDEAHRMSPNDTATYGKFINALRLVNPNLIVVGFTATPFRMGSGYLLDSELFDEIVFDLGSGESFIWAIEQGYLIRPVPADPGFQLDESELHLRGGEYIDSEASQAFRDQNILERAVDMMIKMGKEQGRKSWLTFNQSIEDADLVADMFTYKGHAFEAVHSKRDDRDEVIKAFKQGKLRGISNKDVLTTGFDHPAIDLIGMLRLTRSPGLWVQMMGRGTRPLWAPGYDISTLEGRLASIAASGKKNCLVLDFANNTRRLGPINYPVIPGKRKKGGGGDAPVRICKQCDPWTYHHTSVKVCPECGFEFPPPKTFSDTAGTDNIVESKALDLNLPPPPPIEITVETVDNMVCSAHAGKEGKPDTMRVDYFAGYRRFSVWVCIEHPEKSFARRKAEQWWESHGGRRPSPTSVGEAVEAAETLNKPFYIQVAHVPGYPEIKAYDFTGNAFQLPSAPGGGVEKPAAPAVYEHDDIPF